MSEHDDTPENPIVAMATRIRARRDLGAAIDSATAEGTAPEMADDESRFAALADVLAIGTKRLNSILGKNGVTFVRLEKPLRLRLRFGSDKRISLDLDRRNSLVTIAGMGLEGEYQFDTAASVPALINTSLLSTDEGYGDALTGSGLLKVISADAELPRPAHLDAPGPMRF